MIQLHPGPIISNSAKYREIGHIIQKFKIKCDKYQKKCYYCQHGHAVPARRNTSYFCQQCGDKYPLYSPTVRNCFALHEKHGLQQKGIFLRNKLNRMFNMKDHLYI